MSDVKFIIVDNVFDMEFLSQEIQLSSDLESAVAISLFTDRRVTDEELPVFEQDKRGWWGDLVSNIPNDRIGSRIWTISRSKVTRETLRRYEDFSKESLEWMKEDGIVDEVQAISSYNESNELVTEISLSRPNEELQVFFVFWEAQEIRRK